MAKSVFLSFYFAGDVSRVQQIRNIGAIEGDSVVSAQEWETVAGKGETAIKNWIEAQMKYKNAVVVLVGGSTASRPWVKYEIEKAWQDKRPLVGIRIHGLADLNGKTGAFGDNPFDNVKDANGNLLSSHISLHNPGGSDSKAVYATIRDNFESWVAGAVKRA